MAATLTVARRPANRGAGDRGSRPAARCWLRGDWASIRRWLEGWWAMISMCSGQAGARGLLRRPRRARAGRSRLTADRPRQSPACCLRSGAGAMVMCAAHVGTCLQRQTGRQGLLTSANNRSNARSTPRLSTFTTVYMAVRSSTPAQVPLQALRVAAAAACCNVPLRCRHGRDSWSLRVPLRAGGRAGGRRAVEPTPPHAGRAAIRAAIEDDLAARGKRP